MAGQNGDAHRLVGLKVYDIGSHKMGEVVEVKLNEATGEIDCVIVEDHGVLGFNKHRFPVAWNMLTYSETRHALVFAPGVHRDHEEHLPPAEALGADRNQAVV